MIENFEKNQRLLQAMPSYPADIVRVKLGEIIKRVFIEREKIAITHRGQVRAIIIHPDLLPFLPDESIAEAAQTTTIEKLRAFCPRARAFFENEEILLLVKDGEKETEKEPVVGEGA